MDAQPAAHIFHDVVFADRALSKHPALRKALALHLRQLVPVLPDGKAAKARLVPLPIQDRIARFWVIGAAAEQPWDGLLPIPVGKRQKVQRQIDHAVPPNRHPRRAALNCFAVQSKRPFADRQLQLLRDRVAGPKGISAVRREINAPFPRLCCRERDRVAVLRIVPAERLRREPQRHIKFFVLEERCAFHRHFLAVHAGDRVAGEQRDSAAKRSVSIVRRIRRFRSFRCYRIFRRFDCLRSFCILRFRRMRMRRFQLLRRGGAFRAPGQEQQQQKDCGQRFHQSSISSNASRPRLPSAFASPCRTKHIVTPESATKNAAYGNSTR